MTKDNFIKQLEKDMRSPEFGSGVNDGKALQHDELEFLKQSNWIEGEYSAEALEDAVLARKYIKSHSHASAKESHVLTFDSILHCHYLLMHRLNLRIAGKLRTCDVWIGGKKKMFVSEQLLEDDIRSLCNRIQDSSMFNMASSVVEDKKEAKKLHIQFEEIHPFEDGNGRTGRIAYNAHRIRLGLPIHIILEKDKYKYYEWFRG